jgi:tetratricopeptide (TPR) repeat protein
MAVQKPVHLTPRTLHFRAIGCLPGSRVFNIPSAEKKIPILPGWGHYHFPISSANDSAKIYFDQGLSLYYSYHLDQAVKSFMTAASYDRSSAICYWGQALANGPYFNDLGRYSMPDEIPAIIDSMNSKITGTSEKEKDLILAMQQRYLKSGYNGNRKQLNRHYALAMKDMMLKYPEDLDIAALYIDAIMLEHPWDFWNPDGHPEAWTPELITICERILKFNPHHPGAMHYYIHLTEASRDPQRALPQAEALRITMPGVHHMVHMSSHVYERTGHYSDGVFVNNLADSNYNVYASLENGDFSGVKVQHYLAVQGFCALNGGMLKQGMPGILELSAGTNPSSHVNQQYFYMFPVLAWVRMGQWQSIIESPRPPYDLSYSQILDDFARGLAYLRRQSLDSALYFLNAMNPFMGDLLLAAPNIPFSPFILPARVARNILAAEILSVQKKATEAEKLFRIAIQTEDSIIYSEPKSWILPARQYFGALLLEWKRPAEAKKIFEEDLIMNPGNGWSLTGLYQSFLAEHNTSQALEYKSRAQKAFSKSDLTINIAVF